VPSWRWKWGDGLPGSHETGLDVDRFDPQCQHLMVSDERTGELVGTYLRYGAKVLGPPALDRGFGTIDFLTVLDVAAMDPKTFQNFART